jgi:hypothetical protein
VSIAFKIGELIMGRPTTMGGVSWGLLGTV